MRESDKCTTSDKSIRNFNKMKSMKYCRSCRVILVLFLGKRKTFNYFSFDTWHSIKLNKFLGKKFPIKYEVVKTATHQLIAAIKRHLLSIN